MTTKTTSNSTSVNAGALLHRMNFGMSLASGEVRGVRLNLKKLNGGREPESPAVALKVYASILLPERDVDETLRVLTPMLSDPAMSHVAQILTSQYACRLNRRLQRTRRLWLSFFKVLRI